MGAPQDLFRLIDLHPNDSQCADLEPSCAIQRTATELIEQSALQPADDLGLGTGVD